MPDSRLTGACGCGGVRFELTQRPEAAVYCHCHRCQRRTGTAASANARIAPGSLRITAGEELVQTWRPEDGAPKAFCGACGSALWSLAPDGETIRGVRLGALDADPQIAFTHRQWVDSAAPWEPIPDDGLPRYGGPPG